MEVARLAILAAGPIGSDERAWNLKVAQFTMQIAAMLREPGADHADLATTPIVVARKVLDADVYRAEFVGFSDEEMAKTHRLLVRLRPEHGKPKYLDNEGCEWIRTEPRWTNAGFVMQRQIRNLVPSTPVLVYKCVEGFSKQTEDGSEDLKSRVLVHFEVTGRPKNPPAESRSGPAPAETARGKSGGAGSVTAPPATSPELDGAAPDPDGAVAQRFDKLNAKQRIAFGRYCSGKGWSDFMAPGPENIDAVLLTLGKIEKGEALAS